MQLCQIMTKIASLNLCLGLPNKKYLIKELLYDLNIDVLCMQETEISPHLDPELLSLPGYFFEPEINNTKIRAGVYVKSSLNYVRRKDLESSGLHLVIIDLISNGKLRIINIYRPFNPPGGVSAFEFFRLQINQIKSAFTNKNTLLLGDFNLDWSKKGDAGYAFRNYFEYFDEVMSESVCIQLVKFHTWSRVVNGAHRESTLDHIYTKNPCQVKNLRGLKPIFGDHSMLIFDHDLVKPKPTTSIKRNWRNYSTVRLLSMLGNEIWDLQGDSVQDSWNEFENKLIRIVDEIVPLTKFTNNNYVKINTTPEMRNLINIRKRHLKKYKQSKNPEIKIKIKLLDRKIRGFYNNSKCRLVRDSIVPGNSSSLWKAVNIAKDVNYNQLPKTLFANNVMIVESKTADAFASHFDSKIRDIVSETIIEADVYNGTRKVFSGVNNFMCKHHIMECLLSLKCKNSEGFDRIPQRILKDGAEILINPLTAIFNKIYMQKSIPGQWRVAKTIPVYKNKGDKKDIESYRPIANLCSSSKIFEKLILKRILEIEVLNKVDLTGINQHGFKRGRSTSTLSSQLQSIIGRALDEDNFVLVASLDLSSAFDVVNVDLLLKRLHCIGMPIDIIQLISIWLKERSYYVSVDGNNSMIFDLLSGTVQGSILGPVLYAIFVSPLFDIESLLAFADDNFIPRINHSKIDIIEDMRLSLDNITKWLKESGLKVNKQQCKN